MECSRERLAGLKYTKNIYVGFGIKKLKGAKHWNNY